MNDEIYHIDNIIYEKNKSIRKFNMINYDKIYGQYKISKNLNYTQDQLHACYRINNGKGSISDYSLLSNKKVDQYNLEFLNQAFKGKGLFAVMNKKLWSEIERCVLYACYGQLPLDEFKSILGYDTADKGHMNVIAAKICGNITLEDDIYKMQCEISSIMNEIEKSRFIILYGMGSCYDYSVIDTMSLSYKKNKNAYNNKYLALNESIRGKNFETLEELQNHIRRVISLYSKLQSLTDTVTKEELKELGINNINEYNFEYIIKELKEYSASSTINSIYTGILKPIIKELENNFEEMNNGTESCKGYQYLFGDSIINSNNYKMLNSVFRGRNVTSVEQAYNIAEFICDISNNIINGMSLSRCDLYNLGFKDLDDEIFLYVKKYIKSVIQSNNYKITINNLCTAIKRCIDCLENNSIDSSSVLYNNDALTKQNSEYEIVYVNDIMYVNNTLFA